MILDKKYNAETFAPFLRDFLPKDYDEKIEKNEIVISDQCKIITSARIVGVSEQLDNLCVLEMEHGRDDPRIAMATEAFKLLAENWIHNALVVFKNNKSDNYRLSYLSITLDENDRGAVVKTYSNARRYSFYLGSGAKTNTPHRQLIAKGRVKDLNDLRERFSLEVVNKEFYQRLAGFFNDLVRDETVLLLPGSPDTKARQHFAIRLIGRIIFTWFLKQKKSDEGQLIPEQILSSAAVTAKEHAGGYYHDILERLFFELLNTPQSKRKLTGELFDLVPYLNGGLFFPHADDFYLLLNATGYSQHLNTLKISDDWFVSFFEFLETYNFTIDENTAFDQELSVDPEMLGRIFENLLAEIDEDTGNSARKATGSFYTPREIVDYMVDESLLMFLREKTGIKDEKLRTLISYDSNDNPLTDEDVQKVINAVAGIKVLDPACGSGAFPIGMLQKLVYILRVIDEDGELWRAKALEGVPPIYQQSIETEFDSQTKDYIRKVELIGKAIYGVDIQPIATEVARLRTFLTLIVDEKIDDAKDNRGIKALPNLEFKFVSANTLIPLLGNNAHTMFEAKEIEELSDVMEEYFSSREKGSIEKSFRGVQKKIFRHMIEGKHAPELTQELAYWDPFSDGSAGWFDSKWMFGIDNGFDIVIGNPPYAKKENLDKETIKKLEENFKEISNNGSGKCKTKGWSDDLYVHFIFRGLDAVRDGGILSYITNDSFIGLDTKLRVRDILLQKRIHQLIRCPFETFKATIHTAVFLLQKSEPNKEQEYETGEFSYPGFVYQAAGSVPYQVAHSFPKRRLLSASPVLPIHIKLRAFPKVSEFLSVLDTGIDSGNVRKKIFFKEKANNQSLHRLLQGKQIKRWGVFWDVPETKYKYCDIEYEPKPQKGIGRGGKTSDRNEYWNFRGDVENHHQPERLLLRQTSDDLVVAYQNEKEVGRFYTDNTLFTILPKNDDVSLKCAAAILNSALLNALYQYLSQEQGKVLAQIKVSLVGDLPFVMKQPEPLIGLVDEILALVKDDDYLENTEKQEKVHECEEQIDRLVMDIYGLTDEEKEIIRDQAK